VRRPLLLRRCPVLRLLIAWLRAPARALDLTVRGGIPPGPGWRSVFFSGSSHRLLGAPGLFAAGCGPSIPGPSGDVLVIDFFALARARAPRDVLGLFSVPPGPVRGGPIRLPLPASASPAAYSRGSSFSRFDDLCFCNAKGDLWLSCYARFPFVLSPLTNGWNGFSCTA